MHFISNLKLSVQRKEIKEIYLTTVEIEIAEYTWIKSVQKEFFKDKSNLKQFQIKLGVYLDTDSIYKCKGRLINSSLLEHSKAPIFLPKESYSSNPIILKEHQNLKLSGIKDTINQVRRSIYWIPKLRQLVRSILRKCILSRRFESKPYPNPPSAQLPEFRCQRSLPFQTTGVDYLGPLLVKPTYNSAESNNEFLAKVHIALYTCATTPAVHLDLVPDTSASSFIKSLKRFISRRGIPYLMISNNATCFKNVKLSEELTSLQIKWKFIIEASPWWGGFWEWLVQSTKRTLRKSLFRATVTYEELLTLIVEIEGILNCRPITYVYNDEFSEPLTPSHLIYGYRILSTKSIYD